MNTNRVLLVIHDPYFHSVDSPQLPGWWLHLCRCWPTVTYCPSVEKQAIRQFKYYWLIDWILLLGVHVVRKDQSFVVLRAHTWAVRATLPSKFSSCSSEVIHLWWVFAVCYHKYKGYGKVGKLLIRNYIVIYCFLPSFLLSFLPSFPS